MADAIVLMGHGSRDADGVNEFARLVDAVRCGALGQIVEGGVLEFAGPAMPSIHDAIDRCVAAGARRILAVPILLHHAGHNKRDMPGEMNAARARHPSIEITGTASLGSALDLLEIVAERFHQLDAKSAARPPLETALLLVGRGSTHPEANAEFFKIGRLLAERLEHSQVECCFVSLAGPAVQEGIERCIRLGAQRVLVIPYFLNTGLLVKRIGSQATEAARRNPEVEILVGEHLGVHPRVVELILERATGRQEDKETGGRGDGEKAGSRALTPSPRPPVPPSPRPSSGLVQRYVLPPAEIETLSMQRVETSLRALGDLPEAGRDLVRRIVYATGDPTLAPLIRIHPDAISAGVAALRAGKPILVDVRMVAVALDGRLTARLGCQVLCAIDAAPEAEDASSRSLPRALRGVRALAPELDGGIAVIGTAPTALLELLDLVDAGAVRPALIIGTPVGFVAAADSKAELAARPVPFITVQGTRGGAAMAAAAANTLLRIAASGSELRVPGAGP